MTHDVTFRINNLLEIPVNQCHVLEPAPDDEGRKKVLGKSALTYFIRNVTTSLTLAESLAEYHIDLDDLDH